MPDQAFLADWCDRYLGARPARVLFHSGHLSEVTGAELADGRRVVIKARPADPRIVGCVAVQEHLARAGFPCPEPLTAPVEVGGLTVTARLETAGSVDTRVRSSRQRRDHLIAVVGDTEVAEESVQVTDVAGSFKGSVKAADFIDLVRGAYENRMPHVTWEPAL